MPNAIKGIMTIAVLFFAVIVAYGLVKSAPTPDQFTHAETTTSIRALEVDRKRVRLEVSSQGSVMPYKESELIPEVNGRVSWMSPNLLPGGYFTKDEVLLRIDNSDYRSKVARSRAGLSRALAEEELARFELGRMEELVKKKTDQPVKSGNSASKSSNCGGRATGFKNRSGASGTRSAANRNKGSL